jgi:hypothetical protein
MGTLPTGFWELEDFDRKVLSITYIVQLTRLVDFLPVNLHLGRVQDHSKSAAEANWQQKRNFLIYHVNSKYATCALKGYWDFS